MDLRRVFNLKLLIVVPIMLIIVMVALPPILVRRTNEASAVQGMVFLHRELNNFAEIYGHYPPRVGALTGHYLREEECCTTPLPVYKTPKIPDRDQDVYSLIGEKNDQVWNGYVFSYQRNETYLNFALTATPKLPGQSGQKYFYTDSSGVIRTEMMRPATKGQSADQKLTGATVGATSRRSRECVQTPHTHPLQRVRRD